MPQNDITLREEVRPTDGAAVRDIVVSSGMFNDAEINIAEELVTERLTRGISSGYEFLFAEKLGRVIGYVAYGKIDGTQCSFDLYWIAVHHNFQRQGLGKILLAATENILARRGGARIYLETSGRDQYAPTRAFYERSAYLAEARLADFYAPGDDKCIYVKVVPGRPI